MTTRNTDTHAPIPLWKRLALIWALVGLFIAGVRIYPFAGSDAPDATPTRHEATSAAFASSGDYSAGGLHVTPIEQMQLGWRVAGENPELTAADRDGFGPEPDQASWRKIVLAMAKDDGSQVDIELLRPAAWLDYHDAVPGDVVFLELSEMGVVGDARILAIEPCPTIEPGSGNVVTGRFVHHAASTIDVRIDGLNTPIGCTPNHSFWSVDRDEFVPAGSLLEGEKVLLHNGQTKRVAALLPRPGPETVYNLEVHGEHVYEVSDLGVLVHNACDNYGYVYRLVNAEGEAVYEGVAVGRTVRAATRNLIARLREHSKLKGAYFEKMEIIAQGRGTIAEFLTLESKAIRLRTSDANPLSKLGVEEYTNVNNLNKKASINADSYVSVGDNIRRAGSDGPLATLPKVNIGGKTRNVYPESLKHFD